MLVDFVVLENLRYVPFEEDDAAVGNFFDLRNFQRVDDHRHPARGKFQNQAVDFGLRADVHALRWVIQQP